MYNILYSPRYAFALRNPQQTLASMANLGLLGFLLILRYTCHAEAGTKQSDYPCPSTKCTTTGPEIRFPFRLSTQSPACGHPDPWFELSCRDNKTLLRLPPSPLEVSIAEVDYKDGRVKVFDAKGCMSGLLFNLNLSASPFRYPSLFYKVTYLDCSKEVACDCSWLQSEGCMNSPGHYIYSINAVRDFIDIPVSCHTTKTIVGGTYNDLWPEDPYLSLKWDLPICRDSEIKGGRRGFKDKTTNEIGCLNIPNEGHHRKLLIIGLTVGIFSLLFMILVGFKAYRNIEEGKVEIEYQRKVEQFLEDYESLRPTRYSLNEIKRMTDNFKTKLGEGGYGSVFKGQLPNGVLVAVKVLAYSRGDGAEFINEVGTIGRIHHVNIVRLVGFCVERLKRALIYEFMPNESLEKFIFSHNTNGPSLGWKKIQEIAMGIAKGIEYLHQGCDHRILHFDIKPHNILLDLNLNPKISDFGSAKLCTKGQSIVSMTAARGTMGYIAPEVFSRNFGHVSYKSDIYSFGMLLLEMVGGRKNIDTNVEQASKVYFPQWVYHNLAQEGDLGLDIASGEDSEIAKKLTIVALWCIQWNPVDRPSMKNVVQMLEGSVDHVLTLPPNPFNSMYHRTESAHNQWLQLSMIAE